MFTNWLVVYHENHMDEVKHLNFPAPDNPQTSLDWLAWLCTNLQPGYIVRLEAYAPEHIDDVPGLLYWEWPTGQPPPDDALALARNTLATRTGNKHQIFVSWQGSRNTVATELGAPTQPGVTNG